MQWCLHTPRACEPAPTQMPPRTTSCVQGIFRVAMLLLMAVALSPCAAARAALAADRGPTGQLEHWASYQVRHSLHPPLVKGRAAGDGTVTSQSGSDDSMFCCWVLQYDVIHFTTDAKGLCGTDWAILFAWDSWSLSDCMEKSLTEGAAFLFECKIVARLSPMVIYTIVRLA